MKRTLEIPDDLICEAESQAARQGLELADLITDALRQALATKAERPPDSPSQAGGKGTEAITSEIIAELEAEELLRAAFGGQYRLSHAPVTVSEDNQIPVLTNAEIARLFEQEQALGPR